MRPIDLWRKRILPLWPKKFWMHDNRMLARSCSMADVTGKQQ